MSQAEDLLNSLSSEGISLLTANPEIEEHIIIDSNREITVPESLKRIAVQSDNNIETVTFDCPRYWDGNDLTEMYIYISYIRPDDFDGIYLAENVRVNEEDPNIIHFDWLIGEELTIINGRLKFSVSAKKTMYETSEEIRWYTEINEQLTISAGLDSSESVVSKNPDIINDLITRMQTLSEANSAILDTSLTQFGMAADAGVVGDKLNDIDDAVENKLNDIDDAVENKIDEFTNTVNSIVNSIITVPIGSVTAFAGATAPDNYLLCNGQAVSRTDYSDLFSVLGTMYGAGDGSTTFNVPNIKGRTIVGFNADETEFNALGKTSGEKSHTLTTNEMPEHNHGVTDNGHSHSVTDPGHTHGIRFVDGAGEATFYHAGISKFGTSEHNPIDTNSARTGISISGSNSNISIKNSGGGQAHNNLQPGITMNYIIRAK